MSKYAYTTVYEEFTGLKPPEPKTGKPRRRRGYGHPYRMRLNMQEDSQPNIEADEMSHALNEHAINDRVPKYSHQPQAKPSFQTQIRSPDSHFERSVSPNFNPKVTYKKRRHYTVLSKVQNDINE